jgi:CheY-like chemotaxis protein
LLRARRDDPDIIVLDLQMPIMGGHEVLKELAAEPRTRDIPVIISTSLPITGALQTELSSAVQLLSKSSLSKETLLDALERALERAPL